MPQAWQACVWLGPQRREKTLGARFVHHSPSEFADLPTYWHNSCRHLQCIGYYWMILSYNIIHLQIYTIIEYYIEYYRHTAPKGSAVETIGIPWYPMVSHGIPWYPMVSHGIPWYPMHMASHKPSNLHQVTLHEAWPLQGAGWHGRPPWIWSLINGESWCKGTGTPLSACCAMLILL